MADPETETPTFVGRRDPIRVTGDVLGHTAT
jgi:hypothetical protein